MVKTIVALFLSLSIFSLETLAANITCQPDPHDTQLQILSDANQVSVEVINPMGFSYMPLLDLASESTIPFIQMQSNDLRNLGDHFGFRWATKDCPNSPKDDWIFECHGTATGTPSDITALGVSTSRVHEEGLSTQQDLYKVMLTLNKNNTYFVTIPTATQFCVSQKSLAKRR